LGGRRRRLPAGRATPHAAGRWATARLGCRAAGDSGFGGGPLLRGRDRDKACHAIAACMEALSAEQANAKLMRELAEARSSAKQ